MTDIFDEVSEDLRAERAGRFFKQNLFLLIIGAVLVVLGAAGWQAWQWHQQRERDALAGAFLAAMREAGGTAAAEGNTPARREALTEFDLLANTAPEGYRTLAQLRAAALKANAGDLPGALTLWDAVAADSRADPQLRDIANFAWIQHQVDSGDPDAVQGRLAPLIASGNIWRPLALESQALLFIRTGQPDKARDTLRLLASDPQAPQGVRTRAGTLLIQLGGESSTTSPAGNTGG